MSARPICSVRRGLVFGSAALLASCAMLPVMGGGPAVEAPQYRVGDRWVYRAKDGFMRPVVWEETREIVSAGPNGYVVRVTQHGPSVDNVRTEQWSAPGRVKVGALFDAETRRFEQDLDRYDFPLAPGKTWNQWVKNYDQDAKRAGEINRWAHVGGWRSIATPAGTFDAIAVEVVMHLDDAEFWRTNTDCTYRIWYAPAVKAMVREEKEAQYIEKSGRDSPAIRSQSALLELLSFTPGKG
ncbi:MAG TPA: hypothetical protein VFC24_12225 [Casimicrobiaceae bacterium]|nr:hypothetical protein [Casimicrobiaceae bacterium]